MLRSSAKVNETFRPQRDLLFKLYSLSEAKILNENAYNKYTRFGKIAQYYEFQKGNIPFVESWNFSNQEMLKKWMSTSKLPLIIKRDVSSKGRDVIKIENFDDLDIFLDKHSNVQDYLVQGFIEGGEDLRVIVLGGKAIGAMKRKALEGEFLTNFSLGGQVSSYDIDQDKVAKSIAEKAAQHFCLDYVGVDLIKDRLGDWKLLEINSTCQFKGFEESTGINVASKIIDYLCNAK